MWPLAVLLLSMLASTEWYEEREDRLRELYKQLGLGFVPARGMPLPGGIPVLRFDDGSEVVRLVTVDDFLIAGASLGSFHLGGSTRFDVWRENVERVCNSGVFTQVKSGKTVAFVYRNAEMIPVAWMWLDRMAALKNKYTISRNPSAPNIDMPLGDVPQKVQDHVLAFLLDLHPYLVDTEADIVAAVLEEKNVLTEWEDLKRSFRGSRDVQRAVHDFNNAMFIIELWEKEGDFLEPNIEDEIARYDDALESEKNAIYTIDDKASILLIKLKELGLHFHIGLEEEDEVSRRKDVTAWKLTDPSSPEALLDSYSHKLLLVRTNPMLQWMREHLIRDEGGEIDAFDEPLVYWVIDDAYGNPVSDVVPFQEGPFSLFDQLFDVERVLKRDAESFVEDGEQVRRSVSRKWLVPMADAVRPEQPQESGS